MSCCGQGKSRSVNTGVRQEALRVPVQTVQFEYTGRTGMTISGPVSGASYRFENPGSRVTVDYRDRASFTRVPVLKQVR